MAVKKQYSFFTAFIILVLCINLLSVQTVHADGETPTEPPAPTQVETEQPTELPLEATPVPVDGTPDPEEVTPEPTETEPTATPIAEILTQLPESTEVVVLDDAGTPLPLVTQEAAEIVEVIDPIWCPAGMLPSGTGSGCSSSFGTISELINDMISNTANYTQNGTIYFTATAGASLTLTESSLGAGVFDTLNDYDLTLQGGWNGSTSAPSLSGQTNFASNSLTIGTSTNPWVGSISLNDLAFSGVSTANAVTVYTTTGDITLSNVDVSQQRGENYTALLDSDSGDVNVENGSTFDGDNTGGDTSRGFSATTTTGSINITGDSVNYITFQQSSGGAGTNYNGATLSAPNITLSYVFANNNDGNGLFISNGSLVTLYGVVTINSGENGIVVSNSELINLTEVYSGYQNGNGNTLSGALINGTGSTIASVNGGMFADNLRYGIELYNGKLFIATAPTCPTTGNARNTLGCYNVTPSTDSTGPVITPTVTGTSGANGWYTSDVSVGWSVSDPDSGVFSSSGCTASTLTSETAGTAVTCSATNGAGVSSSASVTIKIDRTAPTSALSVTGGTAGTNGWYLSDVTVHTSGNDLSPVTCTADQFQTAETAGTNFNGSCTDQAGLVGNAPSLTIKLDKTDPTITYSGRTTPNLNGWNNTNVAVNWSCSDVLSGPAANPVSVVVTTEGTNQSATGTCTDQAGNTASDTQGGIDIDKTAPSLNLPTNVTAEATSSAGAVVTYSASAADNLDASVTVSCVPASGSTFALGFTNVECSSTDDAGNTASGTFQVIVGDSNVPVIAAHADVTAEATLAAGAVVTYTSPSTFDLVDGMGTAICSPASGILFALGNTQVACNKTDSHGNAAAPIQFVVHVVDTTPPAIAFHTDITAGTRLRTGTVVTYTRPATSDLVDGPGIASCSPASGSRFAPGRNQVICTATDSHGNTASSSFIVDVKEDMPASLPTPNSSSIVVIPLTGGELLALDCNSIFEAFGVKLSFMNLCDQQTTIHQVDESSLPGKLPDGFSFVTGLQVDVLANGKILEDLPKGSGIIMDFPVGSQSLDQFVVLFWDDAKGEWVEVSQGLDKGKISQALDTTDGLYQISTDSAADLFYQILTTQKTGLFILVQK